VRQGGINKAAVMADLSTRFSTYPQSHILCNKNVTKREISGKYQHESETVDHKTVISSTSADEAGFGRG
jgi:hypothetical protein